MKQSEVLSSVEDLYGESEFRVNDLITKLFLVKNSDKCSLHQIVSRLCKLNVLEKRSRGIYCLISKNLKSSVKVERKVKVECKVKEIKPIDRKEAALSLIFEGYEEVLEIMKKCAKEEVRTNVEELVYLVKRGCLIKTLNDDRKSKS